MIWIARLINGTIGSLAKLGLGVWSGYTLGLAALPVIMFVIAPVHFWAKEKVHRHNLRYPPKPKAPKPTPTTRSFRKPVPVMAMLVTKSKTRQRRDSSTDRYAAQLATLPMALVELVHDGTVVHQQTETMTQDDVTVTSKTAHHAQDRALVPSSDPYRQLPEKPTKKRRQATKLPPRRAK